MIIAFCGHKLYSKKEEHERAILEFLKEKIGDHTAEIYLGGMGDFDEFAYECCKKYQKTNPKVQLFFITPYLSEHYQRRHLEYEKSKYDGIIYPEIENKPIRFAISYRNKWIAEKCDYLVSYVNHDRGGAYKTYQCAKRKGKFILNLGRL